MQNPLEALTSALGAMMRDAHAGPTSLLKSFDELQGSAEAKNAAGAMDEITWTTARQIIKACVPPAMRQPLTQWLEAPQGKA